MDRAEDLQMHNWRSAQAPILLGGSLIPAALQLLRFLRDVDQHPCLYRGPAVSHAIRRYEDFWLPLLNQHNATFPLHPPLDCAWIWHVHRLNPIAYARDCEMLFGRLLDVSCKAHDDKSSSVELTRRLWEQRFPDESYDLDLSRFQYDTQWVPHMHPENATRIEYNLAAAVMRQQGFFYQVSQSHFEDERFLEAAQQRYKAFLLLFKITEFKMFLVPTYDIDLMWHAHQLHPKTYVEDLTKFLGRVLEHDDSDSDRSPGQKLDNGFHETCELWLQNYGDVYERAGAMYRGLPPAPVPPSHQIPAVGTPIDFVPLTPREVMQVYVTILRVQNLPKKQGDIRVRLKLERKCSSFKLETFSVLLREGAFWKHTWTFQAEKSTKALKIELLRRHSSILTQMMKGSDVLGYTSVSWEYLLSMPTLSLSGWLPLTLGVPQSNCPSLYVCISLTPPGPAPYLLRMINSLPTDDKGRMGMGGLFDRRGCWLTRTVLDHSNKQVFIIRAKFSDGFTHTPEDKKCIYIHQGGWVYKNSHSTRGYAPAAVVAVANQVVTGQESKNELSKQRCWCFFGNTSELLVRASDVDPNWDLRLDLELSGNLRGQVRLVCGRKLDYEVKGATEEEERGFVTVIRYNLADAPFGKATALFNWRTGAMEVSQQESVVLLLLLSSIISRSVLDMKHVKVKFNPRRKPPPRSEETPDEWGSVVVQSGEGGKMAKSMAPFYVWWNMSALNWSTMFYTSSNTMFGASGCGAAGSCGAGACGGSACGGAGCGGAAGGGCGGGGGGCGGGGCGGGGG